MPMRRKGDMQYSRFEDAVDSMSEFGDIVCDGGIRGGGQGIAKKMSRVGFGGGRWLGIGTRGPN